MLFMVEMTVRIPHGADLVKVAALKAAEKERSQELQRAGQWLHLWRVAGLYANVSIFDVDSPGELHDILMSLPLHPFMQIKVTALCQHPSAIAQI